MATYSIDKTSEASILAGIKAALSAAGILTTTHYETNSLIVTTTMCPMVIRIDAGSNRPNVYVGTSWTSGDAINGSVTILPLVSITPAEVNVIITGDVLYIGWRSTNNIVLATLFGNVTTADKKLAIGMITSGTTSSIIYNCTDGAQCHIETLPNTLVSTGGYYYSHDIQSGTSGNVLIGTAIDGVKAILAPMVTTSNYVEYGDDIVVPGGDTMGVSGYIKQSLLIVDGKSWAPA